MLDVLFFSATTQNWLLDPLANILNRIFNYTSSVIDRMKKSSASGPQKMNKWYSISCHFPNAILLSSGLTLLQLFFMILKFVPILQTFFCRPCNCKMYDPRLFFAWIIWYWSTPSPWLLRFFRSAKNPHEPNPQHLHCKCLHTNNRWTNF